LTAAFASAPRSRSPAVRPRATCWSPRRPTRTPTKAGRCCTSRCRFRATASLSPATGTRSACARRAPRPWCSTAFWCPKRRSCCAGPGATIIPPST
jgi:hypothetical protein